MTIPRLRLLSVTPVFWIASLAVPASLAQVAPAPPAGLSEVPPVSMGLWQTDTSSTVTGLENTPMANMAGMIGRPHATQSCLTPDKWRSDIQGFNARQQHGCTLSNVHQDPHEISFDEVCQSSRGGTTTAHADILIDNQQSAHGTIVMKVADAALPQPMNINMTMTSHYLGADCGDVKPGEGKMLK
jgi:Protein of unknown function (DUF3617)